MMNISEDMAVRLHRMMWEDMQKELGDNPGPSYRIRFKEDWINRMFPGENIVNSCWLCRYVVNDLSGCIECSRCPIKWPMGHCNTDKISYLSSPISEILALPAKNESVAKKAESIHDLSRDIVVGEVAKASGLPVECDIWSHIKAIQDKAKEKASIFNALAETSDAFKQYAEEQKKLIFSELAKESGLDPTATLDSHIKAIANKARDEGYDTAKEYLAECSGVGQNELIFDHIRAIKEKAVEEYFEKQPAAKMVSMDVDQAFKQYADEQKTPIFHALAEASGLSASNKSVKAHVSEISTKAKFSGRKEKAEEIFKTMSEYSGVTKNNWSVYDHAMAIKRNASNEKDMEILRKTSMQLADKLDKYKDALSKESDLDRNRPVDDHIREIVKNSMEAGATEELERIQSKIEELLS